MTNSKGTFRYKYGISLIIDKKRNAVEAALFVNGKKYKRLNRF